MRYGSLRDAASGAVLVPTVACAESSWERLRGLLGRPALVTGTGLLLAPCASVHSCGMRYAIDLVYLDRVGRVLEVVAGLRPWRMSACWRAHATLELAAGGASAADLVPGRQVVFA
jgi:uncharacterized protein